MHNTMFDYLSATNGLQFLMAIAFVAGFLVLWEVLMSKRPFKAIFSVLSEDMKFAREMGAGGFAKLGRQTAQAAALTGMYLAAIPFLFMQAMGAATFRGVSTGMEMGWSPVRAYFAGRKGTAHRKKKN